MIEPFVVAAALALVALAAQADIVDTAGAAGNVKSLVTAFKAAGMAGTLKGKVMINNANVVATDVAADNGSMLST